VRIARALRKGLGEPPISYIFKYNCLNTRYVVTTSPTMKLGPDLMALLMQLCEIYPADLDGLPQVPAMAAGGVLPGNPAT
jgi:hypothetical protein